MGLPRAGMLGRAEVAIRCLDRLADLRPDFPEIVRLLQALTSEHAPALGLAILRTSAHLGFMVHQQRAMFTEQRVQSLCRLGEFGVAFDEIDKLDPGDITPRLRALHGSLLSMTGRDVEALVKFEEALAGDLPAEDRITYRGEYALSLKRLGRYREAAELLRDLMLVADPLQWTAFRGRSSVGAGVAQGRRPGQRRLRGRDSADRGKPDHQAARRAGQCGFGVDVFRANG
ncbi:tetratricopeptide repeat protein [Kibdelosporangium aridum]|uniref:Tetratricopeptide repeat protein n=1 Tax=Kibdelosporangium aridum TaxID=2030 RepID=A0A1Y5XZG9_KIBAR|nr:hypothetical protein [Kibdelosporangium aridum]SMD22560.1 hypothetical protein SAMN05661093_07491 [Kibdelosporangium aridum]